MDYSNLLTDSKWQLLKELSNKETTPSELAEKTNTSLANISQQLRLLEAYGIVKKEKKEKNLGPGKPKTNYSINKEIINLTYISKNETFKKNLELDFLQKAILKSMIFEGNNYAFYLQRFLLTTKEVIENCDYIGLVSKKNEEINLLLITEEIKLIREKYSTHEITGMENKKKKIACWTHNLKEIEEGIRTESEYFKELIFNTKTIKDKGGFENKLKKLKE
jgi:DNA-binding MarR family transcriptional regulator